MSAQVETTPPAKKRKEKNPFPEIGNGAYLAAQVFFRAFYRGLGHLRVYGLENIPKTGPVIFAANHNSFLDPPLVATEIDRITWFLSKKELFDVPLFRNYMYAMHGFPIKRGAADRPALRRALELLARGETLTLFPEGERSKDGKLKPPELGVSMIALKSRAPVIPVAIEGTREMLPPGTFMLKSGNLKVTYGKPVPLDDLYGLRENRETLQECADRIMIAIAELLGVPPPVREDIQPDESILPTH